LRALGTLGIADHQRQSRRPLLQERLRDRTAQAERVLGLPPRARVEQRHAFHGRPEQLRVLCGERHDRHAAHRMTDEYDVPALAGRLDDRMQVAADLVDGAVLPRAGPGRAVVAVVHQHQPPALGQHPLVVPRAAGERPAMDEHDRRPRVVVAEDLDGDLGAVIGRHPLRG
jgi:hypothetical protein